MWNRQLDHAILPKKKYYEIFWVLALLSTWILISIKLIIQWWVYMQYQIAMK